MRKNKLRPNEKLQRKAETAPEDSGSMRDPEERSVNSGNKDQVREKMLDKTLADSFPTSDPPSSIPDPSEDDSLLGTPRQSQRRSSE